MEAQPVPDVDVVERVIEPAAGGPAIHVAEHPGDGPVILALHGLGGNGRLWDWVAEELRPARVVAPDLRGHGASGWSDDYTIDAHVDDVLRVLTALDLGPVAVVGHSLGGLVGLSLAVRHPQLVTRFVVIDMGPELGPDAGQELQQRRERPDSYPDLAAAFAEAREINPRVDAAALEHRLRHGLAAGPDGRLRWRHDRAAERAHPGVGRRELWARWEASTAPALVVRGELSPILPPAILDRMVAGRRGVDAATIPGSGHAVPTERPVELAAVLGTWLGAGPSPDG